MATSLDSLEYESLHYPSFDIAEMFSQKGGTILHTLEGRHSPKRGLTLPKGAYIQTTSMNACLSPQRSLQNPLIAFSPKGLQKSSHILLPIYPNKRV